MDENKPQSWKKVFLAVAFSSILISSSIISFRACELFYPGGSSLFKGMSTAHASTSHHRHRTTQNATRIKPAEIGTKIDTNEPASIPDESRMETNTPEELIPEVGEPTVENTSPAINPNTGLPIAPTRDKIAILMYHCVNNKTKFKNATERSLTLPTKTFDKQLDWLVTHNYHVISMDAAYEAIVYHKPLPENPVVLTFDDGPPDSYLNVFPALRKRGLSGTFFVIAQRVDLGESLDWQEVNEMANAGMEIESHTMTHAHLPSDTPQQVLYELQESKNILEKHLKRPVDFFAYPFGSYNEFVMDAVKQSGYLAAFSTRRGLWRPSDSLFTVKRIEVVRHETLLDFAKLLLPSTYGKHAPGTPHPVNKMFSYLSRIKPVHSYRH